MGRRSPSIARSGIVASVVIALLLPLLAGACGSPDLAAESPDATTIASPSPSAATAPSAAQLYADLTKAIRSADPSLSPGELNAHVCAVTGAPYSIIVAPYDPTAESEEDFAKLTVAFSGIDAALATDVEGFVHDSQGRPLHATRMAVGYGDRIVLAGHPVAVGDRDGYVLVAAPAQ